MEVPYIKLYFFLFHRKEQATDCDAAARGTWQIFRNCWKSS